MDIESLNTELRLKLGVKPLYGWKRGADLFVMLPEMNSDGTPVYETGVVEGTNLIGSKIKHSKVFYQDLYEKTRPGLQLGARWVLCRLFENEIDPDAWNRHFGGKIMWVKTAWVPVDWTGGRAVGGHLMSDPYGPVTAELQDRAIGMIQMNKKFREKVTKAQMFEAAYDDRKEREDRIQKYGEYAAAKAPVGGWCRKPGEKSDMAIFSGKKEDPIQ